MHRISVASPVRYALACVLTLSLLSGITLSGCQKQASSPKSEEASPPANPRTTITEVLSPQATGLEAYGNDSVSIDASNTTEGYFMVRYQ